MCNILDGLASFGLTTISDHGHPSCFKIELTYLSVIFIYPFCTYQLILPSVAFYSLQAYLGTS